MKKIIYEPKSEAIRIQKVPTLIPTPHFHKEIEIVYIKNGACTAYADRQCMTLKNGELFISFPNQIHYYENTSFGDYYVIIVNPNVFFELKETLNRFIPAENSIDLKNHKHITELLDGLYSTDGKFKNTVIAGILNQIVGHLLSKMELKPLIKTDNSAFQSILAFCNDNFTEEISLDDISNNLHISKYHISHLLSSKLGMSFNSCLNMLRVDMACDLLATTDKKTADISEEVGFGSIRSFNRAFLKITGTTPLKYRTKYKFQNNM